MPKIRLSTTTIQPVSKANMHLGGGWREGVNATERAIRTGMWVAEKNYQMEKDAIRMTDTALNGAIRLKDIIVRRAEKEADEAATVWEASMLAGLEGTVGQDGQRHGGILQKSWTDYKDGKSSPITDLGEIEKNFQASDTYKNLSGLAREKFNQRVMTRRAHYLGAANRQFDRNSQERTDFFDKQADDLDQNEINKSVYLKDDEFESVCRDRTFKMQGRKFRNLMENPEILDQPGANPDQIKWKDPKAEIFFKGAILTENRKNAIGRVAILADNAAASEITWSPDGRLTANDAQLTAAEAYAKKLAEPYVAADGTKLPARISPEEAKALGYKCLQARSQLDDKVRKAIASRSANALAKGDLASLEQAEKELGVAASGFQNGSAGQTAALVAQKSVSKAADERAAYDIMNDLAEGKKLSITVQGPDGKPVTTSIFNPKTQPRLARLFPQVQAAWNDKQQKIFNKQFKAARDQNLLQARGKMMEFAANGNPQGFYNYLANGVIEKKITAGDFTRLQKEFNTGWGSGFKGSPDQVSRRTAMARDMLGLINDRLGVDFSSAIKKDEYGDPIFSKYGILEFDKNAELPSAEVKRQFKKPVRHGDMFFSFGSDIGTKNETISGEQIKGILGQAMNLWSCDGMKLTYDPVTGEDLPEGKTHTVNAVQDFASLLDRVADEKNVLSAAETLKNQAAYATNVRLQARVDAERRQKAMAGSRPIADTTLGNEIEDKDE